MKTAIRRMRHAFAIEHPAEAIAVIAMTAKLSF
jgi:hypothetical protein